MTKTKYAVAKDNSSSTIIVTYSNIWQGNTRWQHQAMKINGTFCNIGEDFPHNLWQHTKNYLLKRPLLTANFKNMIDERLNIHNVHLVYLGCLVGDGNFCCLFCNISTENNKCFAIFQQRITNEICCNVSGWIWLASEFSLICRRQGWGKQKRLFYLT